MSQEEMEDPIIHKYRQDEAMMILVFAQWCVNHDLDPVELYSRAYPQQAANSALQQAIDLTVRKEEAEEISNETLYNVLSLFDNVELSFVVSEAIHLKG